MELVSLFTSGNTSRVITMMTSEVLSLVQEIILCVGTETSQVLQRSVVVTSLVVREKE